MHAHTVCTREKEGGCDMKKNKTGKQSSTSSSHDFHLNPLGNLHILALEVKRLADNRIK